MTDDPRAAVVDVYAEYVRLRREGWSVEAVVKALRTYVSQFDQAEIRHLNALVVQWEAREGTRHMPQRSKMSGTPDALPVVSQSQATSSVIRPISPPPDREKASTVPDVFSSTAEKQFCPRCGKPNGATDNYCFACGHVLQSGQILTKKLSDGPQAVHTIQGTAYLGHDSFIMLAIRGAARPVRVDLKDDEEVTLGRSTPDNPIKPNIDLTEFDAEALGVSRLHASLKRFENTIRLTDLSSKNFTFINGQRIYPRESRVLRDGDEVRLGRLPMLVLFKHRA